MPGISPSRANDFTQCPLLYRFRTIDKLPEPPAPAALRGTLVHAVLEWLFDLPAGARTCQAAFTAIPDRWNDLVSRDPVAATLDETLDREHFFEIARGLLRSYFELEDPNRYEPAGRELYLAHQDGELELRGFVDRLDVAPNGAIRVVDYKTGKAPAPAYGANAKFQMLFYAALVRSVRGRLPAMLQLMYLGNKQIVRHVPTEDEADDALARIHTVWDRIVLAGRTGHFAPRRSRLCSWCSFQQYCPEFDGIPPQLDGAAVTKMLGVTPGQV